MIGFFFILLSLPVHHHCHPPFERALVCQSTSSFFLSKAPVFNLKLEVFRVDVLWFPRAPLCFLSKTPVFSGWFSDDVLIAQIVIHRAATLVSFLNVSGIIRSLT